MTIVGGAFVAAGAVGVVYHGSELIASQPVRYEEVWVLFLRFVAIAAGARILGGSDWSRWLALLWMAYHVLASAFDSWSQAAVHLLILAGVAYGLFRTEASAYFRREMPEAQPGT